MSTAEPPAGPVIRVVTVPHSDAYVDTVLPDGVVHVGPGPWLDPGHLAAHAGGIDVVHLHSGYGHLPEDEVVSWTETVRRSGVPLVLTVHQLRDPGQPTPRRHDAHLAALLATAEVVLTLTPGAAEEIAARFGRTAIVVAHPSIAEPVPDLGSERGLVGMALRAPSAALPDPAGVVRAALSGAVNGGGRLRVFLDDDVAPPPVFAAGDSLEYLPRTADSWAGQLQELHAAVLPESCGTHSRDLEVCRDVGTRVVAPSCGWFTDQWADVVPYDNDEEHGLDPVSLDAAVAAALTRPAPRPADRAWRAEQRAAVRAVHGQVYAQLKDPVLPDLRTLRSGPGTGP
ncbi:Glycosyltransferase Family 4 [Geodermatophilus pulveris]|uniref:Glycosyltransferase Family 4 n=1 Tax=Geodermatophilus pulveris TaxID=1564159 RepID=A0A239JG04_9ACTN|nr:glycosyltransferase [Geodermatophilus pulveris]SNT03654.1 Glycosyltransferase Family 4 [Geodermatophilus pulveris]